MSNPRNILRSLTRTAPRVAMPAALAALVVWSLAGCRGNESPRTFRSPEQAVEALKTTLDGEPNEVEALFGPGSLPVLRSGDPVADREDIDRVKKLIAEKVTYEDLDDHTKVVSFGNDPWPFPFPLVSDHGHWRFDLEGGIEELHNRRIGRNELSTLATLHAYVDAQREYWRAKPMGEPPVFAQRFESEEGTKNGLYWPTAEGEEPSPLGDLVAEAARAGYVLKQGQDRAEPAGAEADRGAAAQGDVSGAAAAKDGDESSEAAGGDESSEAADADPSGEPAQDHGPRAYRGYYFRILTGQGEHAPGGARSYLDDQNRMRTGFAAIAWPASYGNSGIMTFIVNQYGMVFEKDLGEETPALAQATTVYDPDESWTPTGD